ncbi:uncharacterized protein MYCFIDRAFT_196493 [Pseudocercospora fijiensis CIRAD86]|uniref:Uncharacterized protein n=1 Tax=Pseudocercospora fijiensis (strain CIRAD86) TaxID=383855 RepID=M3B120_PSEFD|nr:uncharacterized protein MYCFIDRAFT_196493 [Pseudocercospora fijiensis CIRAD86]EME83127.1 hypothetical protein MYCFIDRAFT_196493 [Pseudocercospora fijiensis CIRAD86]
MDAFNHDTDTSVTIERLISDFGTQTIGSTRNDVYPSPRNNVAARARQVREEILEALEPVEVAPADFEILNHWNRQKHHLAASRSGVLSKNAPVQDHASSLPGTLTDPEAEVIPGEAHGDGEERRDSALAVEWDPSQMWDASDADLGEILERQDAITKLLTKAQKSGKHTTFSPEAFDDGLQFTLRVHGKEDKLSYPNLWVPDPRLRYEDEEGTGDFKESRVIRVFFAKIVEKEASPTRGRGRSHKMFMPMEAIEQQSGIPSYVVAGKYYAETHKLPPPTMVHPALREPQTPKKETSEADLLLKVTHQHPPKKRIFPCKKAWSPPEIQSPKQFATDSARPTILHRAETGPVATARQMLRKMLRTTQKEPRSQKQNHDIDLD